MNRLFITVCAAAAIVTCLFSGCADRGLSESEAAALAAEAWSECRQRVREECGPMWENRELVCNDARMKFWYKVFGEKPSDGRSLYISLHGGGNVPAEVNDGQWENQKVLYAPAEGVYFVPRAAVNDWNMWLRPHIDTLFDMAIRTAVTELDVNPDKVYLLGYSAGGDGVYRMAPRMADSWAAASMMAGHSGEASPLNLRNIGYMTWMGELDAAYDRNRLAVEYGERMDSLRRADPEGYVHETHIMKGMGHWMLRADTVAIDWMSKFRRNPYPDKVVWHQEESNQRPSFYWLSVPSEDAAAGLEARAELDGNRITILKNDYPTLYVNLNDDMIDLDEPVAVVLDGKEIFRGRVKRRASHIAATAEERCDPRYIFSARLEIRGDKARAL